VNHVLDKKQGYLIAKNGCTSKLFCQSIRCWNRQIGTGFCFLPVSFQKSPVLILGQDSKEMRGCPQQLSMLPDSTQSTTFAVKQGGG